MSAGPPYQGMEPPTDHVAEPSLYGASTAGLPTLAVKGGIRPETDATATEP